MSSMFGKPRASSERPPLSPLPECNVAILGCRGAGKSALTVKFLTKRFISEYDPNLEDTYSSEELVDQQPVLLKVMDTADQDGPGNCERYLCWASAFLVVYSIDNRRSFEGCQRYLEVLALHARGCQRHCPVLLLGNKLDMEQYRYRACGALSRRDVPRQQVRVPLPRGVCLPGLRSGAARLPRGRAGGAAPGGAEPARAAALHLRGASLPARGHAGGPAHPPQLGHLHLQHPLHRQLQGDPLGGPGQAGHRQVLAGSEQKESSHAHLAERLQDILGHIPVGCREGEERPSSIPPALQRLRPSMMDSQALQQPLADGGLKSPCWGKASSGNLASRQSAKGLPRAVASLCLLLPVLLWCLHPVLPLALGPDQFSVRMQQLPAEPELWIPLGGQGLAPWPPASLGTWPTATGAQKGGINH
ncbi:ras-like protein family member 12 isoform X2 [Prinia subflava]